MRSSHAYIVLATVKAIHDHADNKRDAAELSKLHGGTVVWWNHYKAIEANYASYGSHRAAIATGEHADWISALRDLEKYKNLQSGQVAAVERLRFPIKQKGRCEVVDEARRLKKLIAGGSASDGVQERYGELIASLHARKRSGGLGWRTAMEFGLR
jgi:hypothetical protein